MALSALVLAVAGAFAAPAQAEGHTPGASPANLRLVGEPGEPATEGTDRFYSTPSMLFFAHSDGNAVNILVRSPAFDDWWYLDFGAPAGERLLPGTYQVNSDFRSRGTEAGFEVYGNGHGCGPNVGTFTVLEASYGPSDLVERFHATFEQRCAGTLPALRGEVELVNHPWRPPLEVSLTIDPNGSRHGGDAFVHGTVTCNVAGTTLDLIVEVTQNDPSRPINGSYRREDVLCGPTPQPWSQEIESFNCRDHPTDSGERYTCYPFLPGAGEVYANVYTVDPTYAFAIDQSEVGTVDLGGH